MHLLAPAASLPVARYLGLSPLAASLQEEPAGLQLPIELTEEFTSSLSLYCA